MNEKKKEYDKKYYKIHAEKIKEYAKKYSKEYRIKNLQKAKQDAKIYRENNSEYFRKYNKEYYNNNLEKFKEHQKEYYKKNSEKIKKDAKKWRQENPIEIKERKKRHYQKHKEKIKENIKIYLRKKGRNDPIFRLNKNTRSAICASLKGNKNGKHWEELVNYTQEDLRKHLEVQFKEGMTWENYGKWHLDHRIPISLFVITSAKCKGFKKCWALENLQPLWKKDNLEKSNKLFY